MRCAQGWLCVEVMRLKNCVPTTSRWFLMGRILISECNRCMGVGIKYPVMQCNAEFLTFCRQSKLDWYITGYQARVDKLFVN